MGSRRGSTLILMTLSLTALFGTVGLVTDLGYSYFVFQQAQTAADAAAMAGSTFAVEAGVSSANNLVLASTVCTSSSITTGTSLYSACQYAIANGFAASAVRVAGGTGVPTGLTGTSVSYWVEVSIQTSIPQMFSAILGNNTMSVTGSAVAGAYPGSPPSIIATGSGGVVTSSSGGAVVCGNINASSIASGVSTSCGGTTTTSTTDPFLNLPPLTCSTGTAKTFSSGSNPIAPGNYASLIVSGTASVIFSSGIYCFSGVFSLQSSGTITNTSGGVLIYDSASSFLVEMKSGGSVTLSALTSPGTYEGVLFFQSRTQTTPSYFAVSGSTLSLTGVIYTPGSTVYFDGGTSSAPTATSIVASSVNFETATSYLGSTSSILTTYTPAGSLLP